MNSTRIASLLAAAFLLPLPPVLAQTGSGAVQLTAAGAGEDFDGLANSGTSAELPAGWYFHETGSNANDTYGASDGSGTGLAGNTYSLGASDSDDRAFGTLLSGSLKPSIGARIENATGAPLADVAIQYTGEQWRLGNASRPAPDRLDFQYSLDAGSIADADATWIDVPALSLIAPITSGGVGALDGNAAANRVFVSGGIEGVNLAAGSGFWIRWLDHDSPGADDALGIDDFTILPSGGPPVDVPPTVSSTVPEADAEHVPLDTLLRVVFSEPVAAADPWFTLTCDETPVSVGASGGPITYTLTPTAGLPPGRDCLLTVLADAITDLDGTPDTMEQDVQVPFTTFDPSNAPPPEIVSVQPLDGATGVPIGSEVIVTFNETVTVSEGAFQLACDESPVAATLAGGGTVWALAPEAPLPYESACWFTIAGSGVVNGYGRPLPGNPAYGFTVAAESQIGAYYGQVNASSPEQLRCSLHHTVRGHLAYPYSGQNVTSTWTILETAQQDANDAERIIDSYRNRSYLTFVDRSGQSGSGPKYNREHTWPNSLGFPNQTDAQGRPNAPYTDTHMLHLTDQDQNSARGNRPLADCGAGCTELPTEANNGVGGGTGVYPGNSNWVRSPNGNQGSFEVWNHRKGDIARAVMYMAIRYEGGAHPVTGQVEPDLELTDDRSQIGSGQPYMGLLSDLLDWHQADPPTEEERLRNDIIQSYQGNRNPFVDHPEWASAALFKSVSPDTCVLLDPDVIFQDGFQ